MLPVGLALPLLFLDQERLTLEAICVTLCSQNLIIASNKSPGTANPADLTSHGLDAYRLLSCGGKIHHF